ncbi:ATP-binding protein [Thermobifida fusca]|uniref:ATP-binding protein n=1 Tax=Thermobifida fusca TaxID=2021 RepID=UPI0020D20F83|nr:ATP-binding protein [Thermobifida fusca]
MYSSRTLNTSSAVHIGYGLSHERSHRDEPARCPPPPSDTVGPRPLVPRPPRVHQPSPSLHRRGTPQPPRQDDAILLTSELATNAIEHTRSGQHGDGFFVTVEHTCTEIVRITVHDSGNRQQTPHVTKPETDDEHGRGLFIVDALADRWGSRKGWHGQETWFEI